MIGFRKSQALFVAILVALEHQQQGTLFASAVQEDLLQEGRSTRRNAAAVSGGGAMGSAANPASENVDPIVSIEEHARMLKKQKKKMNKKDDEDEESAEEDETSAKSKKKMKRGMMMGTYSPTSSPTNPTITGPASFEIEGLPAELADNGEVEFSVRVDGPCTLSSMTITMGLVHTWGNDLSFFLIQPDGTEALLRPAQNLCGSGDFVADNTLTFDDTAAGTAVTCTSGSIGDMLTSTVQTNSMTLSSLVGTNVFGQWTVKIVDNASGDFGSLETGSVNIVCS